MERRVRIYDLDVNYQISYRDVRYPRLEFRTGSLLLILPRNFKNEEDIIKRHGDWIYRKSALIQSSLESIKEKKLAKRGEEEFRQLVRSMVRKFSRDLGIDVNHVFFRKMKSKWGSCSSRKNLTINTLTRHLPRDLIEYVIFHEMAHLIERKHTENFWKVVSRKCRNYQKYESELLAYWFLIQRSTSS